MPEITIVMSASPRTCKAEAHRTLLLGIRKWSVERLEEAEANPSGALPGCAWLPWALWLVPQCKPTAVSGFSHWHLHTWEQAGSFHLSRPEKSQSITIGSVLSRQCNSVIADNSSCKRALQLGLFFFFKALETETNFFQRYILFLKSRFWW